MRSSRPHPAATLRPADALPRLDRSRLRSAASLECDVCIAFDTPVSSLSATPASSGHALGRHVRGRVLEVTSERLVLADAHGDRVAVRLLLPAALDLSPLVGTDVSLEVTHDLDGTRPTVDAVLSDARGQLLLWVRDGALSGPRGAHGLAVRVTHDGGPPRLVVVADGATASATRGNVAELPFGGGRLTLVALRVEAGGASFLVVRC